MELVKTGESEKLVAFLKRDYANNLYFFNYLDENRSARCGSRRLGGPEKRRDCNGVFALSDPLLCLGRGQRLHRPGC